MLTRLSLCLALAAALSGCASYESRYYDDEVVYRDGDYYVPADADRGDYYYAPDDDRYVYGYDYRYGYLPYAPYDPSFGFAGFDGYCSVAYAGCLPWWVGSYLDPRFRFAFGYGWSLGYAPVWSGYGGYWGAPPYRRDRHHDHGAGHGTVPPPAAQPAPVPDVSQPAPVVHTPRPVFGRWVKDPRPEPVPARPFAPAPRGELAPPRPTAPRPPESRWRDARPLPHPAPPAPPRPPVAASGPQPVPIASPIAPAPRFPTPDVRRDGPRAGDDAPPPRRPRPSAVPG